MAIVTRSGKGVNLTANEVDNNFLELSGSITDVITGELAAATASYALTASYAMNASGGGGGIEYENAAGQVSTIARLKISNETLQYGTTGGNTGSLSVRLSAITEHIQGADIIPSTDGVYDLGSSGSKWFDGYFANSVVLGDVTLSNDSGSISANGDIVATGGISADIANIGSINIIEDTMSVDIDALAEYSGVPSTVKISPGLKILGSTYGDKYVLVNGAGTPTENGIELLAAYEQAKTMRLDSPATSFYDRITVVVSPGEYYITENLKINTSYIDVVSLTGEADVMITSPSPWVGVDMNDPIYGSVSEANFGGGKVEKTPVWIDNATYITVRGLNTGAKAIKTRVISPVGLDYDTILIENCVGGDDSFTLAGNNGSPDQLFETISAKATFKNCIGGNRSFMYRNPINRCTFIGCTAGNDSFGHGVSEEYGVYIDCKAGQKSFSYHYNTESNYIYGSYTRCTGGYYSFAYKVTSIGPGVTFTDCIGGGVSFASDYNGSDSGTFINCKGPDLAIQSDGTHTTRGTWINCISYGNNSWNNAASNSKFINCHSVSSGGWPGNFAGTATNCSTVAYGNSFANGYSFTGIAIGCTIYKSPGGATETFPSPSGGGKQINCVHGNNVLVNA